MNRPYDEAYDGRGAPRPQYAELLAALGDPASLAAEVTSRLTARRVTFGASPDGIFALDPVPRVLTEEEWSLIQAGIGQRLLALEAFLEDVYGEGRVFEAGVISREDVEASGHYEPAMRGAAPRRWISFAGLDVARTGHGRFGVIEDQVRMPAGMAYAVAARETLRELLAVEPPQRDLSLVYGELALALQDAAPEGVSEPRVVILSEGPSAAGWWEHETLARELCAPLVTLDDLEHRDDRLVAWIDGRARGVDVVYLRTGEDRFRNEDGSPTAVGAALLGPSAAGALAVVNAPGSGVADDKLVHAHVDELVRFYLDQDLLLPSIPARLVGPDDELDELVVKPRGEMGGEDVVIWRDADERDARADARGDRGGARRLDRAGARDPVGAPHRDRRRARAAARGPSSLRAAVGRRCTGAARGDQQGGARARLAGREQRPGRRRQGHLGARELGLRHQPREDVLGARAVLAHDAHGRGRVAAPQERDEPPVLLVRARQHLVGMGDALDQVRHLALHLGHRGHDHRRVARLGQADVEAHVGAAVHLEARSFREAHLLDEAVEAVEVHAAGPLGGEHGRARLHDHPIVEHRARLLAERRPAPCLRDRGLLRDEGAARAAAPRDEMAALQRAW